MAGTSLGARFYRQIKRHPGVSLVPGAMILPSNSLAALAAPNLPVPCLLLSFPKAPSIFLQCPQSNPCNMSPGPLKSPQTG